MSVKRSCACFLVMFSLLSLGAQADIKLTKPESVGMSSERLKRVGEAMRRMIADEQIPGTVTLIARKGKVVHFEANGLRDIARKLPMQKDTIFRLYSQSKPVTGVAVMMLFEEGRFLLSDPVSKYLPEFANMQVYVGTKDGDVITIDSENNILHVDISEKEITNRIENWKKPEPKIDKGILYKYVKSVSNASKGCVTDQ